MRSSFSSANIRFIKSNELEKQATLVELKTIKQKSLADIKFYGDRVAKYRAKASIKSNKDELMEAVSEIGKNLPLFWSAISVYGRASLLLVLITGMDSPDYLDNIYNDIIDYRIQYVDEYNNCKKTLLSLSQEAKALHSDKKIEYLETASEAWMHAGAGGLVLGIVGTFTAEKYKKNKADAKQAFDDRAATLLDACGDIDALDYALDNIELYQELNDSPVEIIQTEQDVYIKYDIAENEEEDEEDK